jgi:DnaJ-class molecular chaperone
MEKNVTLKLTRNVVCKQCHGYCLMDEKRIQTCFDCRGYGKRIETVKTRHIITQQTKQCLSC